MFTVIHPFDDLTDYVEVKGGRVYHHYSIGDVYPRKGARTSEGRVLELMSEKNALKRPLIKSTLAEQDADTPLEAHEPFSEVPESKNEETTAEDKDTAKKAVKRANKKKSEG